MNECEEETKHTRTCVGYISQVLDNSLDVSKIEISLHEVLVQSDVIDPSVFMLLSQIPKDLQVVVSCDRKVYVMGNILRLQQIMLNILTNALKFAKTGKVEILVSLIATGTVKIEVRDEGPGIAAEHRGKLFSKYGQVEVRQGTGLGLSLCSKFIEAMNGRLYLDAEYARGASFVIEMPGGRSKSIVSRPPSLVLTESNKVDEKYVPFNLVVLLVDDSKAATKLLRRRIENCSDRAKSWDLQVVARTGEEAIKICRGNKGSFDIVIMDQNMQAAGGFLLGHETIRIMREELNMHRTVMVGCSGNAETCDTLFIEAGADGVWTKPTPPTVNMILDLCRYRYSRINEYAAGLPGMVNVLLVENCDFLPDLPVDVPPSWCFHRLICTRDAINEKLSICQIAIVVDETLSSLSTVEAVKLIHGSAHFTGFTILCVDDPEVERRASKYATLVLQKKGLSVGEMLLSLSLLLSK